MMDRRQFGIKALGAAASMGLVSVAQVATAQGTKTIALLFDSLQSPFWVTSNNILKEKIEAKGWSYLEAISSLDDSKQFDQVQSMISRGVDGIVIIQTDANAVIPAIRAANDAGVPMIHFNRPPADSDAESFTIVGDNRTLAQDTANFMVAEARRRGGLHKACILVGDLGDQNAIERRDGFMEIIEQHTDIIEVVSMIPTEWNADKAFAGLTNALQANPDINFLFTPSDFLHPQIEQALKIAGKWKTRDEEGHVLFGGFDGDEGGYERMKDGYVDAIGVQDLFSGVDLVLSTFEGAWSGNPADFFQLAAGFVIDYTNLEERKEEMWGYHVFQSMQ